LIIRDRERSIRSFHPVRRYAMLGPPNDAATADIEDDRAIAEVRPGWDAGDVSHKVMQIPTESVSE